MDHRGDSSCPVGVLRSPADAGRSMELYGCHSKELINSVVDASLIATVFCVIKGVISPRPYRPLVH